uniref:Uncharacterized protein n=1 Tax=Alexandrium monilatum TaxID=311494 RepID=A0A7S4PVF1_9DINO
MGKRDGLCGAPGKGDQLAKRARHRMRTSTRRRSRLRPRRRPQRQTLRMGLQLQRTSVLSLLCMGLSRVGGAMLSELAAAVLRAHAHEHSSAGSPVAIALGDCPL